jgi:hypothetical protein
MEKLDLLPLFINKYKKENIFPDLIGLKYCQDENNAFIEMAYLNDEMNSTLVNLNFIAGDIDEQERLNPLFDTQNDIVDNATNLLAMDAYSLINCFDQLFSKEFEIKINEDYLSNLRK